MGFGVSKVTSKGQVTIPEDIRKGQQIRTGTRLVFLEVDEGILIKKGEDVSREMFRIFEKEAKKTTLTREKLAGEVEEEKNKTIDEYFR